MQNLKKKKDLVGDSGLWLNQEKDKGTFLTQQKR